MKWFHTFVTFHLECGLNYTNIKDATNVNRVEFDVISSRNA